MPTYEEEVLADLPVGYWRLDELAGPTIIDSSGNGFDGTYAATSVFGQPSPIETDAASRAIGGVVGTVPAPSSSLLNLLDNFTWEVWGFHDGSIQHLLNRGGQFGLSGSIQIVLSTSQVLVQVSVNSVEYTLLYTLPALDTFYYFLVTRNGAVLSLIVNDALVASRSDLTVDQVTYPNVNAAWCLGRSTNTTTSFASVILDEPALYDYPLSQARALAHYEAAINQILLHGFSNVAPTAVLYSDFEPTPVSFPWRHNWDTPLIERVSFRTNISRARTGAEEGGVVRSKPRRELEFVQVLKNNDERRRLRAQLWAHQNAKWFIPVRQDVELLSASLLSGGTTVPVTTTNKDYEVGGYIGLRQLADDGSITHWEYQLITAVNTLSVECTPLTYDYATNKSHVYPARRALLDKSINIRGHAAEVEELTITARLLVEDESTIPNRITVWHPTIKYRDYEVFDPQVWQSNDWDDFREYVVDRDVTDIDFDAGVFGVESDTPGAAETFTYRMKLEGRDEIAAFLGWFYERAGSARYLWVPSMQEDFIRLGSPTADSITVEDTNYTDNYAVAEGRRDLAFVYNDLSMAFRRVLSSTDDPETLTLDAVVPSLTNLKFISLLKFCRLEADTLEIAWETNTKVTLVWRFRELTHSPEGTGVSSLSPSASQSVTASPSGSGSPSESESPSVSPSHSASPSTSVSPSASGSPSSSESPSASPSVSPSGSQSPSASVSISPSASTSPSHSASPSPSPSESPSISPSSSLSQSPSASTSPSGSASPSV